MAAQLPSIIERTILANQYRILAALNEDPYESERHATKAEILEKGFEWEYDQIFNQISTDTVSSEVSSEVFDILEMFRQVGWAINKLPEEQKSELNTEKLRFRGFDGNNDKHFYFLSWWDAQNPTNYYREDLGHIAGFNSHSEFPLADYRGMLAVLKTFDLSGAPRGLTFEELQQLQDAQAIWSN